METPRKQVKNRRNGPGKMPKMAESIFDNATYTYKFLVERCGVGIRQWKRLVAMGMPVDPANNRVMVPGKVVNEWIAKEAEVRRKSRRTKRARAHK